MDTSSKITTTRRVATAALVAGLLIAGCAKDDGAATRADCSSSSAAGGASSAAASGAAACEASSGISTDEVAGTSDNPLVKKAVTGYQAYVEAQVNQLVGDTLVFTDAVRAGDIDAAKAAYPTSRQAWERIEPIAALISDIDGAVDSRAGEGVPDTESPNVTGWHQLEFDLWVAKDISGSKKTADELDKNIAKLQAGLTKLKVTPLAVAKGASELIEEVADGKITGEEDRYSHTDLWDLAANVEGAQKATDLLMPAIKKADPALAKELDTAYAEASAALAPYRDGTGWMSYEKVSEADRTRLKAKFSALAEELGEVPGVLELS